MVISTIYRNLEELERLGVVVHSHLGHGPAVYHLASAAYAHLVCSECGAALEAPEEFFGDLAKQAAARYGFSRGPAPFCHPRPLRLRCLWGGERPGRKRSRARSGSTTRCRVGGSRGTCTSNV